MNALDDPPREPDPDPEIEALLGFEPVMRRNRRRDGWSPAHQTGFIAALARLGDADRAAQSVGRTSSGAWTVRNSAGAEGFDRSWDAALDLFHARNPGLSRHGGRARVHRENLEDEGEDRESPPARPAAADGRRRQAPSDPPDMTMEEFLRELARRYLFKLRQEREARLEGRIVEADFYVRQLTWIEVVADIGGNAQELLESLKRGGTDVLEIAATPMSALLDKVRRACWREKGEADRPPAPPMGEHGATHGTGPDHVYRPDRDGPYSEWSRRQEEKARLAAEAQQAWEEKARAEAEEWGNREAAKDDEVGDCAEEEEAE